MMGFNALGVSIKLLDFEYHKSCFNLLIIQVTLAFCNSNHLLPIKIPLILFVRPIGLILRFQEDKFLII